MDLLVTGSSSGIGETVARRLVDAGHRVVLMARRSAELRRLADELDPEQENRVICVPGDVGHWSDCKGAVDEGVTAFGHLDGLINAAGAWVEEPLDEADAQDIAGFIDTDVAGATYITKAILPALRKTGFGRIIHINGLQGLIRHRPPVMYAAVEAAVRGLCESLRWEAATYGVHVSLLTLGGVANTDPDDTPQNKLLHPERGHLLNRGEVADAILYILDRPAGVNIDEIVLTPLGQKL